MGYNSRVTGEITITPPIPVRALAKSLLDGWNKGLCVKYHVEETATEVDEGTLIKTEVTAIVPVTDDSYKAYDLVEHLGQAVHQIIKAGSTCQGELIRDGEDTGDVERLVVRAGSHVVAVEKARLPRPDGTEVKL